jgi:hypothetical protein
MNAAHAADQTAAARRHRGTVRKRDVTFVFTSGVLAMLR